MDLWLCVTVITVVVLFCIHYWRQRQFLDIIRRPVLITGCGTGFGNKLAKSLDHLGVNVYAGCILQTSADLLNEQSSPRLKAFVLDVTSQESINQVYKFVSEDLNGKPLWAIVNNAAIPAALVPFDWTNIQDYVKVFDVNLLGIIRTTLAFLPLVKKGKEGRIINVSSMNGRLNVMTNPYGISKCGLEALSNGLSFELKPFNITVHTLQPSIFKTNMSNPDMHCDLIRHKWDTLNPLIRKDYGKSYLEKRLLYIKTLYLKNTSSKLSQVVSAYKHALFAKYPCNRYVVGLDAKLIYLPLSWLPFPVLVFLLPVAQKLAGLSEPQPQCSESS